MTTVAFKTTVYTEEAPGRLVLRRAPRLFADGEVAPEVHRALFAFPQMCAKLQSARVRVTLVALQVEGAPRDGWLIEDVGHRLF